MENPQNVGPVGRGTEALENPQNVGPGGCDTEAWENPQNASSDGGAVNSARVAGVELGNRCAQAPSEVRTEIRRAAEGSEMENRDCLAGFNMDVLRVASVYANRIDDPYLQQLRCHRS